MEWYSHRSHILKNTERNLPSHLAMSLCRLHCLWLQGAPSMASCPFLIYIAAFKTWSLS